MNHSSNKNIQTLIIDQETTLTLTELSIAVRADETFIIELVEHEILTPVGRSQENWSFNHLCLKRAKMAQSFYHDLEVNLAGLCLAFDLLDKIEKLNEQIAKK